MTTVASFCPLLIVRALFVLPLLIGWAARGEPAKVEQEPIVVLRNGLANSAVALTSGRPVRVAFLGGSITHNPGWRDDVCAFLRERYPATTFDFVAAGIPSMGSLPHAFRLQRDVLQRGPVDLLFLEAAVNDASNMPEQPNTMTRAMEGIVRQVRRTNPQTDIVHFHFVMPAFTNDYRKGVVPETIRRHEEVAAHYGNPSLDLAREVTQRIDAGEFTWKDDFKDLHPSPFGQKVYSRSMIQMLSRAFNEAAKASPKPHAMPEPIDPLSYERGRFISIDEAKLESGFSRVASWAPPKGVGTRPGFVNVPALVAETPGASFTFEVTGTAVGLLITSGPDAGWIEYQVDDGPFERLNTATHWSKSLHLPWAIILTDSPSGGTHRVRVRLPEQPDPAGSAQALRVFHLLVN